MSRAKVQSANLKLAQETHSLEESIGYLLGRAYTEGHRNLHKALADLDLTPQQHMIIMKLNELDASYRAHKSEGLEILAISMDHSRDLAKVQEVMRSYQFPAALISRSQTRAYGSLWRMPITFMIDRQGALRFDGWKFAGKLDHAMLEKNVIPLLREGN